MNGTDHPSDLLRRLLADVEIHGAERSFKAFRGHVLWNRFLVGVNKAAIGGGSPDDTVTEMVRRLGMPPDLMAAFRPKLPEVNFVLFGFEQNETTCVYKVYLEYYDTFSDRAQGTPGPKAPFTMHVGFKWDVRDSRRIAVTEYRWLPMLPAQVMLARMAEIYSAVPDTTSRDVVERIFRAAAGRMSRNDILYLDVTEGAGPRRSFDVNVYQAALRLGDIREHLDQLFRHYAVDPAQTAPMLDAKADRAFGHLAGGIDRQGRDFVTIYYADDQVLSDEPAKA